MRAINAFFTNAWPASAVRDSDPVCPRLVPEFPTRDGSPRRYIYFRGDRSRKRAAMIDRISSVFVILRR
jgi:hypothetical protein